MAEVLIIINTRVTRLIGTRFLLFCVMVTFLILLSLYVINWVVKVLLVFFFSFLLLSATLYTLLSQKFMLLPRNPLKILPLLVALNSLEILDDKRLLFDKRIHLNPLRTQIDVVFLRVPSLPEAIFFKVSLAFEFKPSRRRIFPREVLFKLFVEGATRVRGTDVPHASYLLHYTSRLLRHSAA